MPSPEVASGAGRWKRRCHLHLPRHDVSQHGALVNLVVIGMVSPLINSAYACQGSFWRHNDVTWLLRALPPFLVHVYFAATLIGYLVGLSAVFRRSRTACKERTAASSTS